MSKETDSKILKIINNLQNDYYKNKTEKRNAAFLKEARALTEIESESFVQSFTDDGLKTSYLNNQGIRLACLSNKDDKTYSISKDLALGENVFATWSYDENNAVKDLNVLDQDRFDFAIKTMKPAVEVMEKERLKKEALKKDSTRNNKNRNRPH